MPKASPARSRQTTLPGSKTPAAPTGAHPPDPAITAREVMGTWGIQKSAFYEWQKKGLEGFPKKRVIGKRAVRYLLSEVIAFRDRGLPR